VYLHLGVAANNTKFKIETTAWNEASFRVPDERGWEPASQPIYPEDGKVSLTKHYTKHSLNSTKHYTKLNSTPKHP